MFGVAYWLMAGETKYVLPNADYNAEVPSEACFTAALKPVLALASHSALLFLFWAASN